MDRYSKSLLLRMPEWKMVAAPSMEPMPTTVSCARPIMRLISLTLLSWRMASAISGLEASSGAGIRCNRALKMLLRVLGR